MTHEVNRLSFDPHAPHGGPEKDDTLPNAIDIPEFDDIEDSLAPTLLEDLS